jgi:hypothetical protein
MVTSLRSKWPSARREEGAYLNRYVTDEQRGRRPIFNATLRAGTSWLFFRVARSTRMTQIWALRSRLEKQPTDLRRRHHYLRDGTLGADRESVKLPYKIETDQESVGFPCPNLNAAIAGGAQRQILSNRTAF